MTSPTPPGPAPKAYDINGVELTTAQVTAVARGQLQAYQVPVVLLTAGRVVLAEGWLSLSRDGANQVAGVALSDGSGHSSTTPVFRVDAGAGS